MSDLHRPQHVPSVLIWGGWYGSRNIGDSAILLGLKELIREVNAGADVYVRALSTDVDYTSTHGVTGERALVKSEAIRPWAWLRVILSFWRPDRVVVSGGTPIFDSSHAIRTLYMLLPRVLRVPMVVFGAGVKPLVSWYGRRSIPLLLRGADYVSVRDADSLAILNGLGVPDVELSADSAFFATPAPASDVHKLLASYGIDSEESLMVVAPRLLSKERKRLYLEERMDDTLIANTPGQLASAIDSLAPRFDRVVLMAMHYYGPDSDVPIIRDIARRTVASNLTVIDRELRPEVAIALFRHARLVLGVRLHALLLAASMGTPVVGIAYERKVTSLFERLEMSEYCVNLFDLDEDELVSICMRALDEEGAIRQRLHQRVAELRQRVLESARVALQIT